ncbi:hypothetical protein BKA93DRAFT_821448 [Sparassis latifolia]
MFSRSLANAIFRRNITRTPCIRTLHTSRPVLNASGALNNILEGVALPVQVKTVTARGIHLVDGMILPSACIFLDAKVFLWNVPEKLWEGWEKKHFEIFEMVVPKPEILLFGTGQRVAVLPPALHQYLRQTGIQVDVMDTRNACSTYNLLAEEGRQVAAALLPMSPKSWRTA